MPGVITIATYPAVDILKNVGGSSVFKIDIDGAPTMVRLSSVRLSTFKKSTRCVCCGRVGTIMGLDMPKGQSHPHFNLYCIEGKTKILMTKDHIIPKSRGGKNHISNMQTMCCHCNRKKGDKNPEEYADYLVARRKS